MTVTIKPIILNHQAQTRRMFQMVHLSLSVPLKQKSQHKSH
ncbi:hypothetical protein SPWS13_3136 [Shewanella putrefaciens]|nr:hypothetical protein SPWS13_3136 [Shewanella putrefaciens]